MDITPTDSSTTPSHQARMKILIDFWFDERIRGNDIPTLEEFTDTSTVYLNQLVLNDRYSIVGRVYLLMAIFEDDVLYEDTLWKFMNEKHLTYVQELYHKRVISAASLIYIKETLNRICAHFSILFQWPTNVFKHAQEHTTKINHEGRSA